MFPFIFPGIFSFVKSYIKMVVISVFLIGFVSFVAYHYVQITWYEKKFDQMKSDLDRCMLEFDTLKEKERFLQSSINDIKTYYEKEIKSLQSQVRKDGNLKIEEILKPGPKRDKK